MERDDVDGHLAAILELGAARGYSDALRPTRTQEAREHRRAIREAYGARRGWICVDEPFSLRALACVSEVAEEWPIEFTDHRSFWEKAGRPVAVCAHLYGCDQTKREAARVWASRHGLRAAFPVDFPSWWYPGRTTLIEFTRIKDDHASAS